MKKLLIFAFLMLFNFGFAAFSINWTLNKEVFQPGETGTITFTVSNSATSNTVTAAKIEIIGSPSFVYMSSLLIGDMDPGTSTILTMPFTVKQDTQSGIYIFNVRIQGTEISGTNSQSFNFKEASIPIFVLNKPMLFIEGYENEYNEGDAFNFTINNEGGNAKRVRLKVAAPFALVGANELFLGDIKNSKNVSINLRTSELNAGKNTLLIELVYNNELGNEMNETKEISFTLRKKIPDIYFVQLSKIISKIDNTAKFKVVNGAKALKNVKLSFMNSDIILKEGNEIKIGDLQSIETKEINFILHPKMSPRIVNENATLTYNEEGSEKTKYITIPLTIESNSDIQVYVEARPLPVTQGQEQTFSVVVANTWDYGIESLSVKLENEGNEFFELLSMQDEQYIGTLVKDDFSSVQFKVRIKEDAPMKSNISVVIRYKDGSGNFVQTKKIIPVNVAEISVPATKNDELLSIAVGAILLLAAAYWFFFRKKKTSA